MPYEMFVRSQLVTGCIPRQFVEAEDLYSLTYLVSKLQQVLLSMEEHRECKNPRVKEGMSLVCSAFSHLLVIR